MRRKGEQPVPKQLTRWSPDLPVARAIRDGDHWFYAWQVYGCTSDSKLARLTGISTGRFAAMAMGYAVSMAEVHALARTWGVSSADRIGSMGRRTRVID